MKPSEYWRRQCKATFQFDRIGTQMIHEIGEDTLMWGSDYPHGDGVWPESSKYIDLTVHVDLRHRRRQSGVHSCPHFSF